MRGPAARFSNGTSTGTILWFDEFRLDRERRTLHRGQEKLQLTPKPFETLCYLVENPGRTVEKQELLDAVWKDAAVTEDTLVKAVREVRRVLGDDKESPRYIQTIPREGYRFVAPVRTAGPAPLAEVVDARPPVSSRRVPAWPLVVAGLAFAGTALLLWRGAAAPGEAPVGQRRLAPLLPGSHREASFSPDGGYVTFVGEDGEGVARLYVLNLSAGDPIAITDGSVYPNRPAWSPKNDQIVFGGGRAWNQNLYSVPPLGGTVRNIAESGRNPSFSWDGERLVFERGDEIWLMGADGSDAKRLEGVPETPMLLADRHPAFSPDGSAIAFFQPDNGPIGDFWILPLEGGVAKRLTHDIHFGGSPSFEPSGRNLLVSSQRAGSRTLWRVPIGAGEPVPILVSAGDDVEPALSRDGTRLVYTHATSRFRLTEIDGETGERRSLWEMGRLIVDPSYSPSGDRIAFFGITESGSVHVFTFDVAAGSVRQVTRDERAWNIHPRWGASDEELYFYQHQPSFTLRRLELGSGESTEVQPDWSWGTNNALDVHPRGDRAVYASVPGGVRLVVLDLATGEETALASGVRDGAWSPDGERLAVVDQREWRNVREGDVSVCSVDLEACTRLARGYTPRWNREGTRVYFLKYANVGSGREVWSIAVDGTDERKVGEVHPIEPAGQSYDVSPGGDVLFVEYDRSPDELWLTDYDPR